MVQAVALLPNGRQQFVDSNGRPLVGGTVGTYIPSTLSAKATYSDSSGTTQNANPLTLDALGSAAIWGVGFYRQIVKDVNGNVVWDTVTLAPSFGIGDEGIILDSVAALEATSIGAAVNAVNLNGYYAAGDNGGGIYQRTSGGAGAGKVQSADGAWWIITGPVFTPRQLGAKGDGSNDDSTAITNMFSLTNTAQLFPEDVYLCKSALSVSSGINLNGNGATIKYSSISSSVDCFTITEPSNNASVLNNIVFDGNNTGRDLLALKAGDHVSYTNLTIKSRSRLLWRIKSMGYTCQQYHQREVAHYYQRIAVGR